ncbi:MAG: sulfotransferase domain-containing protein, partial [Bacteroidota bacterium]
MTSMLRTAAREGYRQSLFAASRLMGQVAQKPSFLIIGAQKAATTTLSATLASHPAICMSLFKEVHYFDLHHKRGKYWYERHFPRKKKGCRLHFEASPYYLMHPLVPARVFDYDPRMKLVVILRNPVDRAYSHYQMERKRNHESIGTFQAAVRHEGERVTDELDQLAQGKIPKSQAVQRHSYLHRGYYEDQLRRWLELFARDQLHVIDYDHLTR